MQWQRQSHPHSLCNDSVKLTHTHYAMTATNSPHSLCNDSVKPTHTYYAMTATNSPHSLCNDSVKLTHTHYEMTATNSPHSLCNDSVKVTHTHYAMTATNSPTLIIRHRNSWHWWCDAGRQAIRCGTQYTRRVCIATTKRVYKYKVYTQYTQCVC